MPSGVAEVQQQKSTINNSSSSKPMEAGLSSEKKLHSEKKKESREKREAMESTEEGIEVVLADKGASKVVEESTPKRPVPEQNVFRHPHTVRPRPLRAPSGPHHHPYVHASGSWGYGPPPMHGDYPPPPPPPPRPYPVPPYNASGSFEDHHSPYHHTPHYSPHVHYPPPGGRYPPEDVNVISPNHKSDPHYRPPPITPSPRHAPPPHHYYKYPPTSPVSRPGAPASSAPPRLRNYAMRRGGEGAYTRAQRGEAVHPDDGTWNPYVPPSSNSGAELTKQKPPLVAASFDSDNRPPSPVPSPHPTTPATAVHPPLAPPSDPHYQFYGGGSWGSFDSAIGPPPHYEDYRHYGFQPESPYSQHPGPFSPGGIYRSESFPPQSSFGPAPSFSYSYDEDDRFFPEGPPDGADDGLQQVTPPGNSKAKPRAKSGTPVVSNRSGGGLVLPKAASEVDFDITDPPSTPITPPSKEPVCESIVEVNSFDVLLGRGGGTNSQVGNRRFRKLVQEFQPTYLMVKRKEKPLVARSIVLIIRKRGGRFLKKNEDTGELFEVGDAKAEAKTSQALREGLDVRATSKTMTTKGKKKSELKSPSSKGDEEGSPMSTRSQQSKKDPPSPLDPKSRPPESPPTLPRLHGEEQKTGLVHPHSPENIQFRKRRRMRSADRFFPDFCPPRADLGRANTPPPDDDDDGVVDAESSTPTHRNSSRATYDHDCAPAPGCAGIALDLVTGAARGSFCLGPTGWRR